MREKKSSNSIIVPVILIVIAITGLTASIFFSSPGFLSGRQIKDSLLYPLLRLFVYLGIGLLLGEFIETLGWTGKIAGWLRPLVRWAHLKDESGAAFITSFVSGIGANTLLMTFYEDGKITRREVTLTYLLNSGLPLYLLHLPTTFFLTTSLAGAAGMVYVSITLIAAIIRSLTVLIYCRLKLPEACWLWSPLLDESDSKQDKTLKRILFKFKSRFYRVVLYTFPIYVMVFLLNQWGFFKWLRSGFSFWVTDGFFPVEATGMIIFSLTAEFGAGMAAAGALLDHGALTTEQAALALIAGTIIATPLRALRHQFATHVGLFSIRFGTELLALSQGFRIASLALVAFVYAIMV
ncbi:MAG: nucleoside recognition domain-containing protein [Pseudomonadota bacterium]